MLKRMISLILCMVMVISILPVQTFAAENEADVITQETGPAVETTAPMETVTEPVEETTAPTEAVTEPAEETTAPTESVTEPAEETTVPTEAVEESTEETIMVSEDVPQSVANADVTSGTCGENVIWTLDDEGTLTISGTGDMVETFFVASGGYYEVPWSDYENDIIKIDVQHGVTSIAGYAFSFPFRESDTKLEVNIADSVTKLGNNCFSGCDFDTITLPDSITVIPEYAFFHCPNLSDIRIPDSVTRIEDSAFQRCTSLKTIEIPENVEYMGACVFFESTGLESVTFCGDAPEIAPEVVGAIFDKEMICYYPVGNVTWNSTTMQDYNYETTTWIPYSGKHGHSFDENGSCKCGAFGGSCGDTLNWWYDPNWAQGVLWIDGIGDMYDYTEERAPWFADDLYQEIDYVEIARKVTSIGANAFDGFDTLKYLVIGKDVAEIGAQALKDCIELIIMGFTGKAPGIAADAFENVTAKAEYPGNNNTWTEDVWQNYGGDITWIAEEIEVEILASGTCGENLTWELDDMGTLTISGTGMMENYTLDVYDESSTAPWYVYADLIESIVIGSGVTGISDFAFYNLYNVGSSIYLPDSVTVIGNSAFEFCSKLKTIEIPEGVTEIDDYAFLYAGLESVSLPEGLDRIGTSAFAECENLKEVTIPETVTVIEVHAFANCRSLTEIRIPASVETIGEGAFCQCPSLTAITVDANNPNYCSDAQGILYTKDMTTLLQEPGTLTTYTVPEGVKIIANWAFNCNDNIQNIKLPQSLTTIGDYVFFACFNLTSVAVPESVTSVGERVFQFCTSLQTVILPEEVDDFDACFRGCESLTSVKLPRGITSVSRSMFERCESLQSVEIPDTVESIESDAFYECSALTRIDLPQNLKTIGEYAFDSCTALEEITFAGDAPVFENDTVFYGVEAEAKYPEGNATWTSDVMQDYGGTITWVVDGEEKPEIVASGTCGEDLTWELDDMGTLTIAGSGMMENYIVEMPGDPSTAPWYAYADQIESIVIGSDVTGISDYAFYNLSNVGSSVYLPDSVTVIGKSAFEFCSKLKTIEIPEGVTEIDDYAFLYAGLESVSLPEGLDRIGYSAFALCENLKEVTVPETVTVIEGYAFSCCSRLTEVRIPASVETIGEGAFCQCPNLTAITVDANNSNYCSDAQGVLYTKDMTTLLQEPGILTTYTVPEGVKIIASSAFNSHANIQNVKLPKSLTTIGDFAFIACFNLTSMAVPESVTSIGDGVFQNCPSLKTLVLPEEVDRFSARFMNCESLTSVKLPRGITSVVSSMFAYCESLQSVEIPDTVESIEPYAFFECSALISIDLPKNLETIGEFAFGRCTALEEITFAGDAPVFEDDTVFYGVEAEAKYPEGNATWTSDEMQDYGGTITWVPYGSIENRVTVDAAELDGQTSVWIDGVEYAVQTEGDTAYVDLPDSNARSMVIYSYNSSLQSRYPVGMKVWMLENEGGTYTAARQEVFDDILEYSGMSIRITGKKGIRMVTSIPTDKKTALTADGLAGLTLKEYGTAIAWEDQLSSTNPLTLGQSYVKSNYAYKRNTADLVFQQSASITQYTNVLVNFSNEQCKNDIALRPYMILEDENGEEIVLYGGIVHRSIGYIAYQNRNVFEPDTEEYNYIWDIIHYVYGDVYDDDFIHAWSPLVK